MIYVGLGAFLIVADRVARLVLRRRREHARHTAEYPLTDSTNWRTPSG